jgi:hypothetical protein
VVTVSVTVNFCVNFSSAFSVTKWNGRRKESNMHQVLCQPRQNSLRHAECFKKPFLVIMWLECKPSNAIQFAWKAELHLMFRLPIIRSDGWKLEKVRQVVHSDTWYIAHLWQQCHNSKFVIFQEQRLKVLKCYNFLWVNDNTTGLQWWVLQIVLWHYTC